MADITGTYELGPSAGRVLVKTGREGLAARAGHDLTLEITRWSARVTVPGAEDGETMRIAAMTLFGQTLVVRSARASVLRILATEAIDAALAERIRDRIRFNTNAILDALTAEAKETR